MDTSHENHERVSHAHLPHVVTLGGGFGGLYAARARAVDKCYLLARGASNLVPQAPRHVVASGWYSF